MHVLLHVNNMQDVYALEPCSPIGNNTPSAAAQDKTTFSFGHCSFMSCQADYCCHLLLHHLTIFVFWLSVIVINAPLMPIHRNMTLPWFSGVCNLVGAFIATVLDFSVNKASHICKHSYSLWYRAWHYWNLVRATMGQRRRCSSRALTSALLMPPCSMLGLLWRYSS